MTWYSARRLLAVSCFALLTLAVVAGPAWAHGRGGESTNFESRILQAPDQEGVTWEIYGGDQYLAVTNTSDVELTVTGYQAEPYLRIGPDGVFENRASEAAYVNTDRYGEVGTIPPNVGPEHPPRWTKVSAEPTYAWHDHRIHWMSTQLPPMVVDTSVETLINPWEVVYQYGDEPSKITGELRWLPPPSPLPWLAAGFVLTAPALLGLRARRDGDGWIKGLIRPAAAVLFVVSVLNITHLADDFLAVPAPLSSQLVAGVQTALFIAIGLFGAFIAWRGREGAFTALGVGSAGILVGQGVLYLAALRAATAASVFPDWMTRLIISLSLFQALWVGIVAVVGNRRLAAAEPAVTDEQPAEVTATQD